MRLRLSEAILLGDSLRTRDEGEYLARRRNGRCVGCAIGGAWLAAGRTERQLNTGDLIETLQTEWPWLRHEHEREISQRFVAVVDGRQTLEQLADYVRSIEPAEPGEEVSGEGPNQVSERAELLKV